MDRERSVSKLCRQISRRGFIALSSLAIGLSACSADTDLGGGSAQQGSASPSTSHFDDLPIAAPRLDAEFGVDCNVNIDTIDDYLDRPDVAYRDMRLIDDPADYAAIGGDPKLSFVLEGFKVIPFPYVATLPKLPVEDAYEGESLYSVEWGQAADIVSAVPNYSQSEVILEELFPRSKPIFLVCGGGGYSFQMKTLLTFLGWDQDMIYVIGGMWDYTGNRSVQIVSTAGAKPEYYLWRLDEARIDFSTYEPVYGTQS